MVVPSEQNGQWRTWRRLAVAGSPVIVNGDEFENIELKQSGSAGILSSRPAAVTGSKQHQRDVDNNLDAAAPARAPPAAGAAAAPPTDAERQFVGVREREWRHAARAREEHGPDRSAAPQAAAAGQDGLGRLRGRRHQQPGKCNYCWILLKQETVSGSGII